MLQVPKIMLTKSVSLAFIRRQYPMRFWFKRCFSASVTTSGVIEDQPRPAEIKGYKSFFGENPDSKDVVLKFFNNCDHVTLNKLISYKVTLFKNYSFHEYMTPKENDRYDDIDDFLSKTGVQNNKLDSMAKTILLYENAEKTITGIKFFHPPLEWNVIESADKVVVLDVFHRDFAWCVRNAEDGYITDIGLKKINLKDTYDHIVYHNQIRMFLETIPESEVYLLRTSSARNKIVSKQGSRYAVHQAVVECLIITLLNERHQPTSLTEDLPNADTEYTSSREGILSRQLENRVYLFEPAALKDFYEVTFQKELMAVSDLFKRWYLENHPNIVKWGLDTEKRKNLFLNRGAGQVSVCALITDVFCRTLKKRQRPFPRSYTSTFISTNRFRDIKYRDWKL